MSLERNAFRIVVAAAGLVPVLAGGLGVLPGFELGDDMFIELRPFTRSHIVYLSGLLLGIGLAFWATLRAPEAYSARYRVLTGVVFIGGLARLLPYALQLKLPDGADAFALTMELVVTPAICLWQARIARLTPSAP